MRVVALLGAGRGWHSARLTEAFASRGARAVRLPFACCAMTPSGPRLGRAEEAPSPRAVLVRSIPAGGLEQVTLRLGLLHALEAGGTPVVNGARAIERCVDKSATSFLLARAGLPTPPAWTVESREAAEAITATEAANGYRLVAKPLFGAQGKGLRLVSRPDELPPAEEVGGVWHLQRYVGRESSGWHDYRVFVVAGRPVAAMARHGTGWITNIRQGARPAAAPVSGPLADLAVAAADAVGALYAGVDLIEAADDGGLAVLEVNSMPAWQGLQGVSEAVDIAGELAAAVLARADA
jgi:tetrahydromethanopterin:alpha-L-glutamate ligase